MPDIREKFMRGLLTQSWLSTCIMLLLPAMFVGAAFFVDESVLIGPAEPYVPRNADDNFARATINALHMAGDRNDRPALILTGSSGTADAVLPSADIQQRLRDAGVDTDVYLLNFDLQSIMESAALMALLPEGRCGVVVQGLAPFRFSWSPEQYADRTAWPRIGFRTAVMRDLEAAAGIDSPAETGIYFVDNMNFVLPRLRQGIVSYMTGSPVAAARYPRDTRTYTNAERLELYDTVIERRMADYHEYVDYNLDVLAEVAAIVEERGCWKLIITEAPLNPEFVQGWLTEEFVADWSGRIREFAQRNDAEHWRLYTEAGVTQADYYDWGHINTMTARTAYTDALVDRLVKLYEADR